MDSTKVIEAVWTMGINKRWSIGWIVGLVMSIVALLMMMLTESRGAVFYGGLVLYVLGWLLHSALSWLWCTIIKSLGRYEAIYSCGYVLVTSGLVMTQAGITGEAVFYTGCGLALTGNVLCLVAVVVRSLQGGCESSPPEPTVSLIERSSTVPMFHKQPGHDSKPVREYNMDQTRLMNTNGQPVLAHKHASITIKADDLDGGFM